MNRVILFFLLIGVMIFACSSHKEYKQYTINDLSKPLTDTLEYSKDGRITGVEITVTGNLNGIAWLEFENGAGRFSKLLLKGKVNEIYKTEWYSSKLIFKYLPYKNIKGDSITIKYRMY